MSEMRLLLVPGAGGSSPGHWHHEWAAADDRCSWVEQADWDGGTRDEWVAALDAEIRRSEQPAVLVAHSLGNVVVAHWAAGLAPTAPVDPHPVTGALLVAPADIKADWVTTGAVYQRFLPIPSAPLPFPATLAASTDDPFLSVERAAVLADRWDARLRFVGSHGHLGADADLGEWAPGRRLLDELLDRIRHPAVESTT